MVEAKPAPSTGPHTHIYVLLDRSGSMHSIRGDVIGGFNAFLSAQQADGTDARMTLVQFDTADPAETIVEHKRIAKVRPLTEASFVPRGGTPLLDATGLLVARADERAAMRVAAGKVPEDIIFVTITDGAENSSTEFTRNDLRKLVAAHEAKGWTFVFLSAALDAYGDAGGMGYDPRSVQSWAPDAQGASQAFGSLSLATVRRRQKERSAEAVDKADFFEGHKPAEDDRKRRTDP